MLPTRAKNLKTLFSFNESKTMQPEQTLAHDQDDLDATISEQGNSFCM